MLSELSQEKEKYHMISLNMQNLKTKNEFHRYRDQIGGCQGLEGWESWVVSEVSEGGSKGTNCQLKISRRDIMYSMGRYYS